MLIRLSAALSISDGLMSFLQSFCFRSNVRKCISTFCIVVFQNVYGSLLLVQFVRM